MKLSDFIMHFLYCHGVKHIFGYQGGSVTHLIDSLHKIKGLVYVQNYHEQASALCADSYSRVTGHIGVAIATSGPGATNLITGIANAFFDSIPCIFITGQVSTHSIKSMQEIRQQSFQETDIVSIVRPITKFAKTVLSPDTILYDLEKALFHASSGRPGAVLLDIPHNIQACEVEPERLDSFFESDEYVSELHKQSQPDASIIQQVSALLMNAKKPLVLAGGGLIPVRNRDIFNKFVHQFDIPVVCSLMGLGAISHEDPHYCGFIGSYGNRYANIALAKSDFLLVLGSRLDERQTGSQKHLFARDAKIIHVDVDPHVLDQNVKADIGICCDLNYFLEGMIGTFQGNCNCHEKWINSIHALAEEFPSCPPVESNYIDPNEFIHILSGKLASDAIVCSDVGQNMMWVAQSLEMSRNMRLLNSGGHGTMGYALPAGIGAYFASHKTQIICIMGDGGLQMNIQELQTISRENIPVKIIVMNNHSLGMVRGFHEKYFDNKCYGTVAGYSNPDFAKVAYSYNIAYTRISKKEDFDQIDSGLNSSFPHFFEIELSPHSQIIPEPDSSPRAVEDQFPLLDRETLNRILSS